jgi:hypothetical protein
VVPEEFVVAPVENLCASFNPLDMWSVVPIGEEQKVRFASSEKEATDIRNAWVKVAPEYLGTLIENRILVSVFLLRTADPWVVTSYNLPNLGQKPILVSTLGQEIGFTPTGEKFLKFSRIHTSLFSLMGPFSGVLQSGYLWVAVIPMLVLLRARRRQAFPLSMTLALYSFPWLWVIGLGFVSPWIDTRYVAVAVVWSAIWSILVFGRLMKDESRDPAPRP